MEVSTFVFDEFIFKLSNWMNKSVNVYNIKNVN